MLDARTSVCCTPTDCARIDQQQHVALAAALPSDSTSVLKPGANDTVDTVATRVCASMRSIIASIGMCPSRAGTVRTSTP